MTITNTDLDFGRRILRVGPRDRPFLLVGARSAVITACICAAAVVLAIYGALSGSAEITVAEGIAALRGKATASRR